MDLEFVIHSEVEKNKYVLMNIYVDSEKWYLFAGHKQRCRHREQTSRRGEGVRCGVNWEIGIDVYILPCIKPELVNQHPV